MLLLRIVVCMLLMCASSSAADSTSWHTVVLNKPVLSQGVDYDEFEDSINVTVPSANAAVFKHIGDMTFIQMPHSFEHSDHLQKRNAVVDPDALWPGGVIPYRISTRFHRSEKRVILQAMSHWEEHTCIRFRPRVYTDTHSIFIRRGSRCGSFVGRLPWYYQPQGIELGFRCVYFEIVVHELGHAIGFYHEHNRPDRDDHIDINYENIIDGYEDQFRKMAEGESNTLGIGYDHASIMHYSSDTFAHRDGSDTIQAKDPDIPVGDAYELSPLDITKTNTLYNCGPKESWPPPLTVVPPEPELTLPASANCGEILQGTEGRFEAPNYPNYTHTLDCAWVIEVPSGFYIEIHFPVSGIERSFRCQKDYVGIYYGNTVTGSNLLVKFCERRRHAYLIYHNLVTVYLHTDQMGGSRPGISGTFTAVDHNECDDSRCHNCTNLPGGFECQCRDGYYHSAAASTCFDINECAFENGGCHHSCVNSGGSYSCRCREGYALQSDTFSCEAQFNAES